MLDWYLQAYQNGQPHEHRLTFSSAQEAIEAGNNILQTAVPDEVLVFHRLYSNQACLTVAKVIPVIEVPQKAAHLEQQARAASHAG